MSGLNPELSRRQLLIASSAAAGSLFLASCSSSSGTGTTAGKVTTLSESDWLGPQMANYFPLMQRLTGIKIDHQIYSYDPAKIFNQLASGTAPDLFLIDSPWNGNLFPYKRYYVPFDDELKARGIDMSKWNINPHVENGYDGKIVGLSQYTAQDLIVYINTEMADASGLLKEAPL